MGAPVSTGEDGATRYTHMHVHMHARAAPVARCGAGISGCTPITGGVPGVAAMLEGVQGGEG